MTYVMSDVHGCYREYLEMLEKLAFSAADRLYILGDAIDWGPDAVPLLKDIAKRRNVVLLAGNHEFMGVQVLAKLCKKGGIKAPLDAIDDGTLTACLLWMQEGGDRTLRQLSRGGNELLRQAAVYLGELPLYEEISAGGRDFLLVHAGLEPFRTGRPLEDYGPAELLFGRPDYSRPYFADKITVSGHTPTFFTDESRAGQILRREGHIAIDCGCIYGFRLGAYCLETGGEFYVKSRQEAR